MALTIIVEDGTGKADANSYATVAEGDAYHEGHLYASAWTGATDERKGIALVMATRMINAAVQWAGERGSGEQALEWPRFRVERPDLGRISALGAWGNYWPENEVPRPIKDATAEQARALLQKDLSATPASQGVKSFSVGQGAVAFEFDKHDRPGPLTDEVMRMLEPFATVRGSSQMVRLTRV